jgi:hypothetical protein
MLTRANIGTDTWPPQGTCPSLKTDGSKGQRDCIEIRRPVVYTFSWPGNCGFASPPSCALVRDWGSQGQVGDKWRLRHHSDYLRFPHWTEAHIWIIQTKHTNMHRQRSAIILSSIFNAILLLKNGSGPCWKDIAASSWLRIYVSSQMCHALVPLGPTTRFSPQNYTYTKNKKTIIYIIVLHMYTYTYVYVLYTYVYVLFHCAKLVPTGQTRHIMPTPVQGPLPPPYPRWGGGGSGLRPRCYA